MKSILFITMIVAILSIPLSFADSGIESIEAEGESFDVSYRFDGNLVAMQIDQESTSLLIGTINVQESTLEISFPSKLLAAENAEFVVLVDGLEADYTISYTDNNPTILVQVPEATEEIEIIGTTVIPEFPLGGLVVMGMVSTMVLVFSKTKPFK